MSKLGSYLKDARVKAGLSQGDLAKKMGYGTPQYISNCERGAFPSKKSLVKLASYLKISESSMLLLMRDEEIQFVRDKYTDLINKAKS